jgi:pyrimidine-nucleoside phosphorylase
MLYTAGKCGTVDEARRLAENALISGQGARKLKEMIRAQGGDERIVEDTSLLPQPRKIIPFKADREGYISTIKTQEIGISAQLLGAGRTTKEDSIDPAVGIVMNNQLGDYVNKGDTIAEFYVNEEGRLAEALDIFHEAMSITSEKPERKPLIYGVVTSDKIERWQ